MRNCAIVMFALSGILPTSTQANMMHTVLYVADVIMKDATAGAKAYAKKVVLEKVTNWGAGAKLSRPCSEYDFVLDIPDVASFQYGWPMHFAFFWKAYLPIENTLNGKRPRLVHRPRAGSTPTDALRERRQKRAQPPRERAARS